MFVLITDTRKKKQCSETNKTFSNIPFEYSRPPFPLCVGFLWVLLLKSWISLHLQTGEYKLEIAPLSVSVCVYVRAQHSLMKCPGCFSHCMLMISESREWMDTCILPYR